MPYFVVWSFNDWSILTMSVICKRALTDCSFLFKKSIEKRWTLLSYSWISLISGCKEKEERIRISMLPSRASYLLLHALARTIYQLRTSGLQRFITAHFRILTADCYIYCKIVSADEMLDSSDTRIVRRIELCEYLRHVTFSTTSQLIN